MSIESLDDIIRQSLHTFASVTLGLDWHGKEHDWVNRYTFSHLLPLCSPTKPLHDPGQLGVEVGIAQPPGYEKLAVNRDLVIWPRAGMACWNAEWKPVYHPLAILEWKVHRPRRLNRNQPHERDWLRRYSTWQPEVLCYAVEVTVLADRSTLRCCRFHAGNELADWLLFTIPLS